MFKHGLKVVAITLLCAIVAVCFVIMGMAVFAPSQLSKTYENIGVNSRAYVYAERAYEKDDSIENLVRLANLSIKLEDNEKINARVGELILHESFNDYLKTLVTRDNYYDFLTSEYIKSCYALELYEDKVLCEKALKFATNGYRKANAIESLILVGAENSDIALLEEICLTLNNYQASGECIKTSVNRLNKDIFNLEELIQRLKTNEYTVL